MDNKQLVYCIFPVHMWTNKKPMLSSQQVSFIIHLAFCISFESQKRLTLEARLFQLFLATAAMVILKCFYKKKEKKKGFYFWANYWKLFRKCYSMSSLLEARALIHGYQCKVL